MRVRESYYKEGHCKGEIKRRCQVCDFEGPRVDGGSLPIGLFASESFLILGYLWHVRDNVRVQVFRLVRYANVHDFHVYQVR